MGHMRALIAPAACVCRCYTRPARPPTPACPGPARPAVAANNSAAAAALSSEIMVIDPTTGRWEMRDDWADAVNEVRLQARHGSATACLR